MKRAPRRWSAAERERGRTLAGRLLLLLLLDLWARPAHSQPSALAARRRAPFRSLLQAGSPRSVLPLQGRLRRAILGRARPKHRLLVRLASLQIPAEARRAGRPFGGVAARPAAAATLPRLRPQVQALQPVAHGDASPPPPPPRPGPRSSDSRGEEAGPPGRPSCSCNGRRRPRVTGSGRQLSTPTISWICPNKEAD